jgi:hypothetical protein
MEPPLLAALIGSFFGLLGTAVGGVISYTASRSNQAAETRSADRRQSYQERESLFSDFLAEAMQVFLIALHTGSQVREPGLFHRLVTLEARIWLHSRPVADNARNLARFVMQEAEGLHGEPIPDGPDQQEFHALRDAYLSTCSSELARLRDEA